MPNPSLKWLLLCMIMLASVALVQGQRSRGPPNMRSRQSSTKGRPDQRQPNNIVSGSDLNMNTNCKIINGVKTCSNGKPQTTYSFNYLIISASVFIVGFLYYRKRQINLLKDVFKKEMAKFQELVLASGCKLREDEKDDKISEFKDKNYVMFDVRKDGHQDKSQLKLKNIEKIKDRLYEINFEFKDINGEGNFQGLLGIMNNRAVGLKMIKLYKNTIGNKIKQTKAFLVYEGKGNVKTFSGAWSYLGKQQESGFSGAWEMK